MPKREWSEYIIVAVLAFTLGLGTGYLAFSQESRKPRGVNNIQNAEQQERRETMRAMHDMERNG